MTYDFPLWLEAPSLSAVAFMRREAGRAAAVAWRAPLIILKINCLIVLPAVFDKVSINMLKILLTTTAQWFIPKKSYLENCQFQAPKMKMKLRCFGDLDALKIIFIFEKELQICSIHADWRRDHAGTLALFRRGGVKNWVQVCHTVLSIFNM